MNGMNDGPERRRTLDRYLITVGSLDQLSSLTAHLINELAVLNERAAATDPNVDHALASLREARRSLAQASAAFWIRLDRES